MGVRWVPGEGPDEFLGISRDSITGSDMPSALGQVSIFTCLLSQRFSLLLLFHCFLRGFVVVSTYFHLLAFSEVGTGKVCLLLPMEPSQAMMMTMIIIIMIMITMTMTMLMMIITMIEHIKYLYIQGVFLTGTPLKS